MICINEKCIFWFLDIMARLVSINKIDAPPDTGGGATPMEPLDINKQSNGDCSIYIDFPIQSNKLYKEKDAMKKSPSMGNFCTRRSPVNVQWRNITLTTKKGNEN